MHMVREHRSIMTLPPLQLNHPCFRIHLLMKIQIHQPIPVLVPRVSRLQVKIHRELMKQHPTLNSFSTNTATILATRVTRVILQAPLIPPLKTTIRARSTTTRRLPSPSFYQLSMILTPTNSTNQCYLPRVEVGTRSETAKSSNS